MNRGIVGATRGISMLTHENVTAAFVAAVGDGLKCQTDPTTGRIGVLTPFQYPDGGMIELFVREKGESVVVSDLGETLRHLSSVGVDVSACPLLASVAHEVGGRHRVALTNGVFRRDGRREELGALMMDVLAVVRAVADAIGFQSSNRPPANLESPMFWSPSRP